MCQNSKELNVPFHDFTYIYVCIREYEERALANHRFLIHNCGDTNTLSLHFHMVYVIANVTLLYCKQLYISCRDRFIKIHSRKLLKISLKFSKLNCSCNYSFNSI